MKTYNVDAVRYRFWLLPPDGKRKDITALIGAADLTSTEDGIVDTVSLSLKNEKIDGKWIHEDLYLAKRFLIEAKDEENDWEEVFRGTFSAWQTNASDFTMNSTASDGNQMIVSNDMIAYFPDNTAASRVRKMLGDIGVPIGAIEGMDASLNKELEQGDVASKILDYKDKAEEKTGKKTVIRSTKGKFEIVERGKNKKVYVIDSRSAQEGTDAHSIPSDFATIVKVYGSVDGDKVPPLQSTVTGDTKMGSHVKIIHSSDYKDAGDAKSAANNILKDQGRPEVTSTVRNHVDIPWVRVGDAIDVMVGTIGGMEDGKQIPVKRYVKALSRDFVGKTMTLELEA